ncbi:hypothetical protein GPECTOR_71g580 [Gonium pectorale]|uniref:Uncharacterized protein n=1 Tax=Gonium pectorale TaxID=33097 RepID=A0A150G2W6_GONPE|nr:hypothetical protein GPECTOR_71g580 [Gonium pectorale]|eukprot:KXZ44219.1 hypothetical protein GPECTOR_71g580 [Gonium pectorale]
MLASRARAAPATHTRSTQRRAAAVRVQAQRSGSDPSPEILTAFFYGRAFAITLNRRLSEAVIDLVSEVSKTLAERPQRIADFQEEVMALARKEMAGSGFLPESSSASAGSASSGSGGSGAGGAAAPAPQDPQAAIDELRAEIAYARASLNEVRAKQREAAAQN